MYEATKDVSTYYANVGNGIMIPLRLRQDAIVHLLRVLSKYANVTLVVRRN